MKLILLAAFALATPALAQTDNSPPAQPTAADPAQAVPQSDPSTMTPQTDPSMTPQTDPSMTPQTDPSMTTSTPPSSGDAAMADPAGGYQPTQPAMSGTMQPGATVRFQQAQSPDQAYPAPAPMAHYPVCKKGQYDKCIERGGRK